MSVPFSVAAASRVGTFNSSSFAKPSGITSIYWEFAIPNQADYENTSNEVISKLFVNGADAQTVWHGGASTNKLGTTDPPPAVMFDITGVPTNATLQVQLNVNPVTQTAFTIGIQNGLIS